MTESPSRSPSLPAEILTHIFTHLYLPSLHAVRLASKTFYYVTKTRQFWCYYIDKLVKARHVSLPEDELDNYTADELEQWALRRSRVLHVFFNSTSEQPRFRKRALDLQHKVPFSLHQWNFKLIPGGRWLLILCPSAIVYFLDLDCVHPTPRILFDPKEFTDDIHKPKSIKYGIWMDRKAPRLSFRLALLVKTEHACRTYISQVDLAGHGRGATLIVSNVAVFRDFNLDVCHSNVALNDRYLVQACIDEAMCTRIDVYDYRLALGYPDYPLNHDGNWHFLRMRSPGMIEFIYDDILAIRCVESEYISIFAVEPSTSPKLLCRFRGRLSSLRRWTPRVTITTMTGDITGELQGLVIPHEPSCPPKIVYLGRFNQWNKCYHTLGTWLSVAHNELDEVTSYNWDFNFTSGWPSKVTYRFEERTFSRLMKIPDVSYDTRIDNT